VKTEFNREEGSPTAEQQVGNVVEAEGSSKEKNGANPTENELPFTRRTTNTRLAHQSYFLEGRLLPDSMETLPVTREILKLERDEVLARSVAVFDGTSALHVRPLQGNVRNKEETWAFWVSPRLGDSQLFSNRLLTATVSDPMNPETNHPDEFSMEIDSLSRKLVIKDSSHVEEEMAAKTNTMLEDGLWHHCAISFSAAGEASVYVDGKLEAVTRMEPPTQRPYSYLYFGRLDPAMTSGQGNDPCNGLIARVADLRHYSVCLATEEVHYVFTSGPAGKGK
jgi:hypothetical protein